jgi:ribosome-associated protein
VDELEIRPGVELHPDDVQMEAMRASGAGGQNVNKVSSAIHLRFDIRSARLPESLRERLLARRDARISSDGVLVIKAQRFRTQARNRADALQRLVELLREASQESTPRRPTQPTRASLRRRLDRKTKHSKIKALRGKPKVE